MGQWRNEDTSRSCHPRCVRRRLQRYRWGATGPAGGTQEARGTLLNDKEFDSSVKHGGPATFAVNQVIKGWTEALQMMPVGSKWELFVPPSLAYGPRAAGPDIGPNSTLVFEVELLSIQPKNPAPEKPAAPESTKPD